MWPFLFERVTRSADRRAIAALPVGTLAGEAGVIAVALPTATDAHAALERLLHARPELLERCCVVAPSAAVSMLLVAGARDDVAELTVVCQAACGAFGGQLAPAPRSAASSRLAAGWAAQVLGVLPEFALVNAADRVLPGTGAAAHRDRAVMVGGAW